MKEILTLFKNTSFANLELHKLCSWQSLVMTTTHQESAEQWAKSVEDENVVTGMSQP